MSEGRGEIFAVSQRRDVAESGGGHNQKGTEFQKNWALVKILELESAGAQDYLILFEAVQDIAILDSEHEPTTVTLYQLKKKDRGEWGWSGLTLLHEPQDPTKPIRKRKQKPLQEIRSSHLGKLYAAVRAFGTLSSYGRFLSNAGCDVILADGSNAATSLPVSLDLLPQHFVDLLTDALKVYDPTGSRPDPARLVLEKISIPVDDPLTYSIGKAHDFLLGRSPKHAGQARSFVESLLTKFGPLGAKTATCRSFEEMRRQHGYSRGELVGALTDLASLIDPTDYLDDWLNQLRAEGLGVVELTQVRAALTELYRRTLLGAGAENDALMANEVAVLITGRSITSPLLPFIDEIANLIAVNFPGEKLSRLRAHVLLGAIEQCVAQS